MNLVRIYTVLLLAGICLLGCRSSSYSRRDIETIHSESEQTVTHKQLESRQDAHLYKVQEIDGSWWSAHIKFDTSATPDSLGLYPVSEVELQGSLSQTNIQEEAEINSEAVEVTQEVEERNGITETDMAESATVEPVHGRYGLVVLALLVVLIALLYIMHSYTFSHAQRNSSK